MPAIARPASDRAFERVAGVDQAMMIEAAIGMAQTRFGAGDLAAAETILRDLLRDDPANAAALRLYADIAAGLGRTDIAITLRQTLQRTARDDARNLEALMALPLSVDRRPAARSAARDLVVYDPAALVAWSGGPRSAPLPHRTSAIGSGRG